MYVRQFFPIALVLQAHPYSSRLQADWPLMLIISREPDSLGHAVGRDELESFDATGQNRAVLLLITTADDAPTRHLTPSVHPSLFPAALAAPVTVFDTARMALVGHANVVAACELIMHGAQVRACLQRKSNGRFRSAVRCTASVFHQQYSLLRLQTVTASWDRTARLWDSETGSCLLELLGHDAELTGQSSALSRSPLRLSASLLL